MHWKLKYSAFDFFTGADLVLGMVWQLPHQIIAQIFLY